MYESPISLQTLISNITDSVYTQMAKSVNEQVENQVVQSVSVALGCEVNKEELLKALKYDRHQYDTGFNDGIDKAIKSFISLIKESDHCPSLVLNDNHPCCKDCKTCQSEYYTDELMTEILMKRIGG